MYMQNHHFLVNCTKTVNVAQNKREINYQKALAINKLNPNQIKRSSLLCPPLISGPPGARGSRGTAGRCPQGAGW